MRQSRGAQCVVEFFDAELESMNERGAASRICGHPYGCERVELRKTTAVRLQQSEHMIILSNVA